MRENALLCNIVGRPDSKWYVDLGESFHDVLPATTSTPYDTIRDKSTMVTTNDKENL